MLTQLASSVWAFLKGEEGPTSVEYALMLALIIAVCVSAISYLGSSASNTFQSVGNTISGNSDDD